MDHLSKQQLTIFKSIIKQIMDSDRVAKIELDKAKKLKEIELNKIKYQKAKLEYKPKIKDVIENIKENIFEEDFDDISENDYYNTSNFIKDNGDIKILKEAVDKLILEFSTDLVNKK